jgi:hypothetical protein
MVYLLVYVGHDLQATLGSEVKLGEIALHQYHVFGRELLSVFEKA